MLGSFSKIEKFMNDNCNSFYRSNLFYYLFLGSYMQEESPEGGRFKKEVVVDGQSYLLLIRDEGGPPELQVRILLLRLSNEF